MRNRSHLLAASTNRCGANCGRVRAFSPQINDSGCKVVDKRPGKTILTRYNKPLIFGKNDGLGQRINARGLRDLLFVERLTPGNRRGDVRVCLDG